MGILTNLFFGPPSGQRLALAIARVVQRDLRHAVIYNKEFWQTAGLDQMDDEHVQDMVHNFTMSALTMVYLMLDTSLEHIKNSEQRELYVEARSLLVPSYLSLLKGDDDPAELLPNWNQVLARYCEDYRQIYCNEKEFLPDINLHNPWVNIVGIGAAVRLRDAVPDSADPLPEILIRIFGEMSGRIDDCIIKELRRIN